jgi:type II secretory pathway component PulK
MRRRHRGIIFVTALGIIVILTGLALVFAQAMRNEALASANRRSQAQADSVELGAEQWVLAQVDEYTTDAYTLTTEVQTDTIPLGAQETTGYFWVLPSDISQVQGPVCGITDESSKLNLNMASETNLVNTIENLATTLNLNLPQDTPYSIYNWTHTTSDANGASDSDYASMGEPYDIKSTSGPARFETVEELLMVGQQPDIQQNLMPQLLWGTDAGRNALRFEWQQNGGGQGGLIGGTTKPNTGLFNYLTVYSLPPTGAANGNRTINPFTASEVLLESLGTGMTQAQAQSIVQARETNASSSGQSGTNGYRWAISAASPPLTAAQSQYLTGQSYRYSADIVAVSADGRAFRRVRIVVDCSRYNPLAAALSTQSPPTAIIYRKDLTAYGWPLLGTQKQFEDMVAKGQPPLGWLGQALSGPGNTGGTVGQVH